MNLLIVDDEESAILAVTKGIHWENRKFSAVYTATNILEAKDKLERYDISVLLCDIEMPMGSGLELLEWVNEKKPGISCIFMTCHADFSFAQQALHLGSFDYILKPLDFENLEKVLDEAASKVKQEATLKQAGEYWEKGRKAVEKQFWRELFIGDIAANESSIRGYLKRNHLEIPVDGKFVPILISPRRLPEDLSSEDRKLFHFSLRNVTEEVFRMKQASHTIEALSEDKVLVVLTVHENVREEDLWEKIRQSCCGLSAAADQYLHMQVCCYVGTPGEISGIPAQIEQLHTMDFNNILLYKMVLYCGRDDALRDKLRYPEFLEDRYRKYQGSITRIMEEIQQILIARSKEITLDRDFMEQFYMGFYYMMNDFSVKNNVFLGELIDGEKNRRLLLKAERSVGDLTEWLQYLRETLQDFEKGGERRETPVNKVKEYIASHLDEDLSVEKVAQQVHLNPDYLNRIFKKEMGVPLNKYTIQQKMERAKWLLRHTDWQIGEVAASVGYYNYSSFNRSFSKTVGMSPQEWKGNGGRS